MPYYLSSFYCAYLCVDKIKADKEKTGKSLCRPYQLSSEPEYVALLWKQALAAFLSRIENVLWQSHPGTGGAQHILLRPVVEGIRLHRFSRTFRAQQYDDTRVTSPDRTLEAFSAFHDRFSEAKIVRGTLAYASCQIIGITEHGKCGRSKRLDSFYFFFTACQNSQNSDSAGLKQRALWFSMFASLLGMGIDFATFLLTWVKFEAVGGATLENFLQVLAGMVGLVGDISALLGNIASLTGLIVFQGLSDMLGAGANSLAAILKFISGAVNSWWVKFTGDAIMLALQSVQDIATDGLMPVIGEFGAAIGSLLIEKIQEAGWKGAAGLVSFGISSLNAFAQTYQFQADVCGLETAADYAANGCHM